MIFFPDTTTTATNMIAAWLAERLVHMRPFRGRMRLAKLLLRFSDGNTITSRYGVRMRIRASDFTNQAAVAGTFRRDYDDVYREVAALEPGMAFVDIGANHGLFTLIAGERVGPRGVVLAFEPDLTSFHFLVGNVLENRLTNVFPFNAAISERNGKASFRPGPETHSGVGRIAADGPNQIIVMNFRDNMELFGSLLGDRRIVIKIDVEGHEAHVINALSDLLNGSKVEKLIVEVDKTNLARHGSTETELYDALTAAGFLSRRGRGTAPHYNDVFERPGLVPSTGVSSDPQPGKMAAQ